MMIVLFIPLGILCLSVGWLCFKVNQPVKAVTIALIGVFFLVSAWLMGYGSMLLLQNIKTNKDDGVIKTRQIKTPTGAAFV
ncbi:MAG: hypothetical protein U9R29_01860 [Thermodesulfobacteriota bacterium]|nr:hypothetical protein [Thermodesulfobacteriota bacterium]